MKKFLKFSLISILLIFITVGAYWAYIYYLADTSNKNALNYIPDDAVFIVETNNLSKAWTEISNSEAWTFLTKNAYFSDINSDIEDLNKYLKENQFADLLLKDRTLTMSVHMISQKDWDFIFVVDLKKMSNVLKGNLKAGLGFVEGYTVTERLYKGFKIVELSDNENPNDIIYLTLAHNLLVVSFSGILIERSIDQSKDLHWENNEKFATVSQKIDGNNLFKMFVNYSQISNFSLSYLTEESETVKMLSTSLAHTAFNINLENEMLSFKGFTNIDSTNSYIKALSKVNPGKFSAWEILSNQTSLYMAMSFENYKDFYQNLINQYKEGNTKDMEDIDKNVKLIEKLLGISMEQDFFGWIGSEISFAKLRPGNNTRIEDVLIVFKTKDIENAKAGLGNIIKKIKRRTPLKFEKESYKNYDIQCLEIKGFFKVFFGKMFADIEKPYFTYIEDYVVFSNSLETLKNEIDDYITGNTLSHNTNFVSFKDEFNNKANLTLFLLTPRMYENLYFYSKPEDRKAIKENKEFILSFAQIGFQLTSNGENFETLFMAKHDPNAVNSDQLEVFEKEVTDDLFKTELDSLSFKYVFEDYTFTQDTLYKEFYPESNVLKVEGKIVKNIPDGLWKEYYENGNIKSSVNYINGYINGEAFFFYDKNPKVTKAEMTFENDKVIGNYFEYYENGTQKAKIIYKKGKSEGDAEFYHPNGKLKIKANYKDGLRDGKWEYFDERGGKVGTEKWKNGEKKK